VRTRPSPATRQTATSEPGAAPPTSGPDPVPPTGELGPAYAASEPHAALSATLAATPSRAAQAHTRLRLDLSYDGSGFHGWSRQPGLRTVQQVAEEALARALVLADQPVLTVAGRTDSGVHARGQVAHIDVPSAAWQAAEPTAVRRLARLLPPDVRVRAVGEAPAGFDARFSALWRRYSYRVCDNPAAADPLRRHDTLAYPRPVDVGRMNHAAAACLGEHDFAAFCRAREGATTVRELLRLDWEQSGPGVAVATVIADAFCHNMVRALVGALLAVGDGRRPPGWPGQVLVGRVRDPSVTVAAPHGLCLEEVRYPSEAGLAARAAATRRVRPPLPSPT
jgi:tRNA pseudouridine38-40 synthase